MKKILYLLLLVSVSPACSSSETTPTETNTIPLAKSGVEKYYEEDLKPFYHGVASGDPTDSSVIIWTRVTPDYHQSVEVDWKIFSDSHLKQLAQEGTFVTDSSRDYTVKIDVSGLQPGTFYYYRFSAMGKNSVTGRTKTAPAPGFDQPVSFAFASCSNFSWGYFNVYRMMSEDTLDAVVHLGDYIYEHEENTYSDTSLDRHHIPSHELISLSDYRTRYSQYRLDPDLRRAHQQHPFIVVWDDHEFANNTWKSGAANHQKNEGDWNERFNHARKVYYEWMPVRESKSEQLYRYFDYGKTARLFMLDTRVEGRDEQIYNEQQFLADTSRKIISNEQFNWLSENMNDEHLWNIIGNQVMFSNTKVFFSGSHGELYNDGWAAYPGQQKRLMNELVKHANTVIVSGDFHSAFVLPFSWYNAQLHKIGFFTEFVVPSISAGNYDEDMGTDSARIYESYYQRANKELRFVDLMRHGYLKLTVGSNGSERFCEGRFTLIDGVKSPERSAITYKAFMIVLEQRGDEQISRLVSVD